METRKLNVFISQPMSYKSKDEILETRERIIKKVKDLWGVATYGTPPPLFLHHALVVLTL